VTPTPGGFQKQYLVSRFGTTVMEQITDYRTFTWDQAIELLDKAGFTFVDDPTVLTSMFLTFERR
jgi:beta-lactam-binding protein with PASTA domain